MWHRILILCFMLFMPMAVLAQGEMPAAEQPVLEEPTVLETALPAETTEVVPADTEDATPTELIIQTEQIAWNQFRFRPASRLGLGSFQYEWDFGDGQTAAERVVEHAYAKPGRYSVTLRMVEPDGTPHVANMLVRVGFFHLANWRLWVILGLLALIIILASVTAGVTESIVPESEETEPTKPSEPGEDVPGEPSLEPLADQSGDFDSFAAAGEETKALGNDLALLEAIGTEEKEKPSPLAVDELSGPQDEAPAASIVEDSEPEAKKRKPAKKKTTKKRPGKKRTIKVKSVT